MYNGILYRLTGGDIKPEHKKITGTAPQMPKKGERFIMLSDCGNSLSTSEVIDTKLTINYIDLQTKNNWYRLVLN
jgi:hypothetical protein